MFSAEIILSVLSLLMITGFTSLISKKIKTIPYTVLLVLVGIMIALVAQIPGLSFITAFELTPKLLFYVFLPVLIFEAAYNVHIKKFYKSFFSITLLSTVGLIASTLIIGFGSFFVLNLLGIYIPLLVLLLFGSIISATDPVAVLALFKTLGAPKRLSLIFEGESLFNDATAVALFLALLAILQNPLGLTQIGIIEGSILFATMIIFGIIGGYVMGKLFSWLISKSKSNKMAVLSFMLVMAHLTFLLTELLNEYWQALGLAIGISPIIATTIASMELGNNGGLSISPKIKTFIHGFWDQTTFFANSMVFLLVGILVVQQNIFSQELFIPATVGIIFVFISRILSTYPLLSIIGRLGLEERMPRSWRILISWASIRGALSIIIVLTIPTDLAISGWELIMSPRDFIVGMTLGAVVASLIGKTLTIPWVLKKLDILKLNTTEIVILSETQRFINILKKKKLKNSYEKGYVADHSYNVLLRELVSSIENCPLGDSHIFENVIAHYALGIEKYYLDQLYRRDEITTKVYRMVHTKIDGQEISSDTQEHAREHFMEKFVERQIVLNEKNNSVTLNRLAVEEKYSYYRTLCIMARKVVKDIQSKQFPGCYSHQVNIMIHKYTKYKNDNQRYMNNLEEKYSDIIQPLLEKMTRNMLYDYEESLLDELVTTNFTTNRVRAHLNKKT
jgi:CPA1 family monovalent cation:H+ antiporter